MLGLRRQLGEGSSFFRRLLAINPLTKMVLGTLAWPLVCENWYLGVFASLDLWKDREVVYRFRDGTKAIANLDSTEFQILREAFLYDTYGLKGIAPNGVEYVIDGGAHIGFPAINIAKAHPKATIFCIEPCKPNVDKLKKNISINRIKNIETIDCAISDRDKVRELYVSQFSAIHSLSNERIKPFRVEEVSCLSLASIMRKLKIPRIDLLKLDIEGEEYKVLFSLPEKLIRQIKYIVVEAHPMGGHVIGDLEEFLQTRGFTTSRPYSFENVVFAERAGQS